MSARIPLLGRATPLRLTWRIRYFILQGRAFPWIPGRPSCLMGRKKKEKKKAKKAVKLYECDFSQTSESRILFTRIWHYCATSVPRCGVSSTEDLAEWVAKGILLLRL
ncbi:hypothetical protein PUN28_006948 [Cardiocondyla obscurior]|uniref:Uncharacterized protein n=1 Tax=Cardiocondyla obscurior TaxID=286306 RepID=A0AAW2G2Q9_9HYME